MGNGRTVAAQPDLAQLVRATRHLYSGQRCKDSAAGRPVAAGWLKLRTA